MTAKEKKKWRNIRLMRGLHSDATAAQKLGFKSRQSMIQHYWTLDKKLQNEDD